MENDEKSDIKPKERPQNKNLKRDAGPGRPPKQRNYATIYREALINIAKAEHKTPEEIETMLEETGLKHALKGQFAFWKDVRDRIHGTAPQVIKAEVAVTQITDEEKEALLALLHDTRGTA